MERGEKKVGRLVEGRLLFSFLFTRCSAARGQKFHRNTKSDTASDNLIQRIRDRAIFFFFKAKRNRSKYDREEMIFLLIYHPMLEEYEEKKLCLKSSLNDITKF